MFADIMRLTFAMNQSCTNVDFSEPSMEADYCSEHIGTGIVRAYSIIVGDVDLDSYRKTPDITFFWMFFTMFAVVILFNVLIAIVTESYQRAFMERSKLFGKVRVPLLARQEVLKEAIKPTRSNSRQRWCRRVFHYGFLLIFELSFIHFISLLFSERKINTVMESVAENQPFIITTSIIFMFLANVATIVDIFNTFKLESYFHSSCRFEFFDTIKNWVARAVFGIKNYTKSGDRENKQEFDGWIHYVLAQTKEAIEISEHNILSDIRTLELRLEHKGILT